MERVRLLQQRLRRKKIGALLVSQPENRRYLSGYTAHDTSINESSGYLLIPHTGESFLLTDFRFQQQAEEEANNFQVLIYKKGVFSLLAPLLSKLNIKSIAYDPHYFLCSQLAALQKLTQERSITTQELPNFIEKVRQIKFDHEIEAISCSVSLNESVFQEIYPTIRAGMTEIDVAIHIENIMRQKGADRPSFETIVASGPNGAKPHAVPSSRKIKQNEPIIIDMGLVLKGYCSDMTRTIVLGTPDAKTIRIIRLVRSAQLSAMSALKPKVACKIIDKSARQVITNAGYGKQFGHALGHGVGLAVHEAPSINSRNHKILQPGMVVTIEPGIYIPGWGGVRLENMAIITANSYTLLNKDTTFLDI